MKTNRIFFTDEKIMRYLIFEYEQNWKDMKKIEVYHNRKTSLCKADFFLTQNWGDYNDYSVK